MGMGFAPTWLRQVIEPPPRLHKTTLTTAYNPGAGTGVTLKICCSVLKQ